MCIMEETLVDVDITNIKIDRKVNPLSEKTAWRSQGEKYNSKPNDTEYYKKYFQEHKHDKTNCERCGKEILKWGMSKHQKSMKCRLTYLEAQNQQ